MKIPTSIWKWQNKRLSIIKIMVLLGSTSVEKKDSSIAHFFFFFFFYNSSLGQCSRKWWSSHFYLFTTQWLQLDTRTRYDSIWMPPAVYRDGAMNQEWHVWKIMLGGFATNTMSTTWSCKAIWQWWSMSWMKRWKVAWQYISKWLWKCHNR